MAAERLSIVMTMRNRAALLRRSLHALCVWQHFLPEHAELVIVDESDDKDEVRDVLSAYSGCFYRVQLISMDKTLSKIPVLWNNPALGVNIAVKAAENEVIYKTDPECLPITETVWSALQLFDPARIWFFCVRHLTEAETEEFSLERLEHTSPRDLYQGLRHHMPDLWAIWPTGNQRLQYWFGAVFSRSLFMRAGGVDEEFLRGFAGEDDEWAERLQRNGAQWSWSELLQTLHQFHGVANMDYHHSPGHWANIKRLQKSRDLNTMTANVGYDWGSEDAVLGREIWGQPLTVHA